MGVAWWFTTRPMLPMATTRAVGAGEWPVQMHDAVLPRLELKAIVLKREVCIVGCHTGVAKFDQPLSRREGMRSKSMICPPSKACANQEAPSIPDTAMSPSPETAGPAEPDTQHR